MSRRKAKGKENLTAVQRRIGANIKRIRKEKGLTQEDMISLGFDLRHYRKVEGGHGNPTAAFLFRVAQALDVDISDLTAKP